MYCNSCMKQIPKDQETHCEQCQAPLHIGCANHCATCGKVLCDTCYADNNYRCEECYSPEENLSIIRRSYIQQYENCPYSLYLQLVKGVTPPMGSAAQLGIIVHAIIDGLEKGERKESQVHAELQREIEEWNISTDDEYSIITMEQEQIGHKCLDNFMLLMGSLKGNFLSEEHIVFSLDDNLPSISCTLDRISFVGQDIHINDWKTGKPLSGQRLVTELQPPLYIYAVYSKYGKMPKTFNLHYLQTNKIITYELQKEMIYKVKTTRSEYALNVQDSVERTKKILKGIRDKKFQMPQGNDQWRCDKLCWFGISGKCSRSQNEEWKQLNEKYAQTA